MLSRVYDPRTRFRELVVTDPAPAAPAKSSSPTLPRSQHFGWGIPEIEQAPAAKEVPACARETGAGLHALLRGKAARTVDVLRDLVSTSPS